MNPASHSVETPRTDALMASLGAVTGAATELPPLMPQQRTTVLTFARQLERELAEAMTWAGLHSGRADEFQRINGQHNTELDSLREQVATLKADIRARDQSAGPNSGVGERELAKAAREREAEIRQEASGNQFDADMLGCLAVAVERLCER